MAGTIALTVRNYGRIEGERWIKELVWTCTADAADGSYPVVSTDDQTLAGKTGKSARTFTKEIVGWTLHRIAVNPGATGPTANSDFTLLDKDSVDLLDGNGTDLIQNATSKASYPQINGLPAQEPITGALTVTITNNSVNSAVIVITLKLVKSIM